MVVGVVTHLMTLGSHADDDIRILHHLTAHHKERGADAPLLQAVQQLWRTPGRRPIVEGQGHIFDLLPIRQRRPVVGGHGAVPVTGDPRTSADRRQHQRRQRQPYSFHAIPPSRNYMRKWT